MTRLRPSVAALWLGLAYAAAVSLFLLAGADAPDVVALSLLLIPWVVAPAALAAFGAGFSQSTGAAWAFVAVELAVVGSTAWLWTYLIVVAPGALNGVPMILFPVAQYAAVLLSFAVAGLLGWRPKP
jgi:hypothetical protein